MSNKKNSKPKESEAEPTDWLQVLKDACRDERKRLEAEAAQAKEKERESSGNDKDDH
ncbi:MAG: hypothetical protein KME13_11380 [Myxacorys californica WJT36-NPBG1]|jgi:hypothetical protein|nr:hypothetical protein [Myxacorys californica WJT36-NPBG1]